MLDPLIDRLDDFISVDVEVNLDDIFELFWWILEHFVHGILDSGILDDIAVTIV